MTARTDALAAAALDWRDPDHEPRHRAAREAVARGATTEEAAAFACNQFAAACTAEALARWARAEAARLPLVAVRQAGDVPMLGARAFAAAALFAEQVHLGTREPLLQAFAADVNGRVGGTLLAPEPGTPAAVLDASDPETRHAREAPGSPVWHAPSVPQVAIVGGAETDDEWIGLAEDLLLHDGRSPHSVRVVWAPDHLSPDDLLDAMAGFRELFPARPDLDGTLQMPRAFLKAAGTPHAWAPGFMLSKGDPEVQAAGHVRWAPYTSLDQLQSAGAGGLMVAAPALAAALGGIETIPPGDAHRPPLAGHLEAAGPFAFLAGLQAR